MLTTTVMLEKQSWNCKVEDADYTTTLLLNYEGHRLTNTCCSKKTNKEYP